MELFLAFSMFPMFLKAIPGIHGSLVSVGGGGSGTEPLWIPWHAYVHVYPILQ